MQKQENKQFVQIDIPQGITAFLEKKAGISRKDETVSYGVTEIVKCLRKSFYERNTKKKIPRRNLKNLWPSVRGDLLHQITKAYNWNELDVEFCIPLGNSQVSKISGRLDMYDWKTRTIIDLKTTKDVFSQAKNETIPKQEDILQVQCYGTIFSNIIPVENLVLIYADLNDMIAFRIINEDKTGWLKDRILKLRHSLKYDEPPVRELSKFCIFCKFYNQCKPCDSTIVNENHKFMFNMNEGDLKNES